MTKKSNKKKTEEKQMTKKSNKKKTKEKQMTKKSKNFWETPYFYAEVETDDETCQQNVIGMLQLDWAILCWLVLCPHNTTSLSDDRRVWILFCPSCLSSTKIK